jgi:Zn-dependent M28 family amino/carboxypeptidase
MMENREPPDLTHRLRQHVEQLARTPRTPGTREHRQAAEYIRYHFEEAGLFVRDVPFEEAGVQGTNLLVQSPVQKESAGLPLLIVGAHYDTKPGTPGADDNASAIAALLELARWIAPRLASPDAGFFELLLAAYDLEEYGCLGSQSHSRELLRAGASLRGMISLEMLGYTDHRPQTQRLPPNLAKLYPSIGNFIGVCGNEASRKLLQTVTQALKTVPELPVESIAVPGNGELLPEIRLSDHSSFWDRNYPALMITDTSFLRNPHYHQPTDTPQTLDYPFLAKVTAGVGEAVQRILQSELGSTT